MKGIIRGKSQTALTGSLKIDHKKVENEFTHQESLVRFRLQQEFPDNTLLVMGNIIPSLTKRNAFRVPVVDFRRMVREELLKQVTLISPDHTFNERTDSHTLYLFILDFTEERLNKINAYEKDKKNV